MQFIEANAGPNEFDGRSQLHGGGISIAQNFTTDVDKLKRVAGAAQGGSQVERNNADPNLTTLGNPAQSRAMATASSGAESFMLGIRLLAQNLASVLWSQGSAGIQRRLSHHLAKQYAIEQRR